MKRILITGGAGFIGSSLIDKISSLNQYEITVIDNLSPQIHGLEPKKSPQYLRIKDKVNFIYGDICDEKLVKQVCKNQDIIIHLAAETGTGQSMYEIKHYVQTNDLGTAILLENTQEVSKFIVASSRAVYGEGKYINKNGDVFYPNFRDESQLNKGIFNPVVNGEELVSVATDENSQLNCTSIYGVTKLSQEKMVISHCISRGIDAYAFRFQNVYGPGQSLKNPYTGILSIFSTLLRQNQEINIFEDGEESRDFVYIDDVVQSIVLALENSNQHSTGYNVGTGVSMSVLQIAEKLKEIYSSDSKLSISGNYRLGDIRHAKADIDLIKNELNYNVTVDFNKGIERFCNWVLTQELEKSNYEESLKELKLKRLLK